MSAALDHGEQLAIAVPAQRPDPHPWTPAPDASASGIGPCQVCGDGQLAEHHRPPVRDGARLFFDVLAGLDHDRAVLARAVLQRGRDDLARLAREHPGDERFAAGVAWGHALAGLAVAALDGEQRPDRLSFVELRRRATRRGRR